MKKLISSLLICCILAAVLTCSVFAAGSPVTISLTSDKPQAVPGDTVTVTVSASSEDGVHGVQTDVTYNPEIMTFQGAQGAVPADWYAEHDEVAVGTIRILCYDDTEEITSAYAGDVYKLTFEVKEGAYNGVTPFGIENLYVPGADGSLIPEGDITKDPGQVEITGGDEPPVINGDLTGFEIPGVELKPPFDPGNIQYQGVSQNETIKMKIDYTGSIKVTVNGNVLDPAGYGSDIQLRDGKNLITIQDKDATYTFEITWKDPDVTTSDKPGTSKPGASGENNSGFEWPDSWTDGEKENPQSGDAFGLSAALIVLAGAGAAAAVLVKKNKK